MINKIICAITIIAVVVSSGVSVSANASSPYVNNPIKTQTVMLKSIKPKEDKKAIIKSPKDMSDEEIKKILLDLYQSDPQKYEYINTDLNNYILKFKNVTYSADLCNKNTTDNLSQSLLKASYVASDISGSYWVTDPYQYDTVYWINYCVPWLTADNYNCATPVQVGVTQSQSVSVSYGYSGTISASDAISASLTVSASGTKSYSTSITNTFTIPGWTKKAQRAYIKYKEDKYKGYKCYYTIYTGGVSYGYAWEYASNKTVYEYGTKYWEMANSSHIVTNNVPSPPVGWEE